MRKLSNTLNYPQNENGDTSDIRHNNSSQQVGTQAPIARRNPATLGAGSSCTPSAGVPDSTPGAVPSPVASATIEFIMTAIGAGLAKIDGLLTMPARVNEIFTQLKELSDSTIALFAELTHILDSLSDRVLDLERARRGQDAEVDRLKSLNDDITERVSRLELNSLNSDLIITGVPEIEDEDLVAVFQSTTNLLGVTVSPTDILEIVRWKSTAGNLGKPGTILVRLKSTACRNRVLAAKRAKGYTYADELGLPGKHPHSPVFVNGRLSPFLARLLGKAKDRARQMGYTFVRTRNGAVIVKRDASSDETIIIRSEADLELLVRNPCTGNEKKSCSARPFSNLKICD